jgi:hypothetical protein
VSIRVKREFVGGSLAYMAYSSDAPFNGPIPVVAIYDDGWISPPTISDEHKDQIRAVIDTARTLGAEPVHICNALETLLTLLFPHLSTGGSIK